MRTLEKVKAIRQSVNCTYEEARNALTICYGSIPKAIVYIENKYGRKAYDVH